jgi:hypothetical protein
LDRLRARRFPIVFGLLLFTLIASPFASGLGRDLLDASLLLSLLAAGLGGLGIGRGVAVVVLVLLGAAARGIDAALGASAAVTAGDVAITLAAVFAGLGCLREALRAGAVTHDRVYAASSVYLLAGLAFALVYHALDRIQPGALLVTHAAPGAPLDRETAVYFSFVTLATLGYGDVVPVAPIARSLAIAEAVGAQLFIAILIARLVSLYPRGGDR